MRGVDVNGAKGSIDFFALVSVLARLASRRIRLRRCGVRKLLVAEYARADGGTLTIGGGKPEVCANFVEIDEPQPLPDYSFRPRLNVCASTAPPE